MRIVQKLSQNIRINMIFPFYYHLVQLLFNLLLIINKIVKQFVKYECLDCQCIWQDHLNFKVSTLSNLNKFKA